VGHPHLLWKLRSARFVLRVDDGKGTAGDIDILADQGAYDLHDLNVAGSRRTSRAWPSGSAWLGADHHAPLPVKVLPPEQVGNPVPHLVITAVLERVTPRRFALACREAFLETILPDDVRAITAAVVRRAKDGDLAAARFVLERFLGGAPVAEWPTAAAEKRDSLLDDLLG